MSMFPENSKLAFRLLCWVSWILALLCLALDNLAGMPKTGWLFWDKLHHAAAYALLTWLGGRALTLLVGGYRGWLASAVLAILFGGVLELLQMGLTDHRSAEWGDLLADGIGAVLVCAAALIREFLTARKEYS